MIESIMTRGFWAESLTKDEVTRTVTVYVGDDTRRPKVTAEVNLSRLEGSGSVKAFISSYEYQGRFDPEPWFQQVEPPLNSADPLRLVKGISQYTIPDAVSVTFGITVTNMFAYANCSVFVYQTLSLADILFAPVSLLGRVVGP